MTAKIRRKVLVMSLTSCIKMLMANAARVLVKCRSMVKSFGKFEGMLLWVNCVA